MELKKNRSLVLIGIIVMVIIIIRIILRLNPTNSNTTFKAEVIDKIGGKEITTVDITSTINFKSVRLANPDDKSELNGLLNELSSFKLKKVKKISQTITLDTEVYSLAITVQKVLTYYISLFNTHELSILDFTKNKPIQRYKIESEFDLEKIKKYWSATS